MEANELRIGNYVHHKDEWSYRQPKQDYKEFDFKWDDSDFHALLECTISLDDIEPIPLTEDILLKCGFTSYIKNEYVLSNGYFSMWIKFFKNGNVSVILNRVPKKYLKGEKLFINSVHHLQNLYFALTNQELEINL